MESKILREYRVIVDKFLAGTASPAELEQLDSYYSSFDDPGKLTDLLSERDLSVLNDRIKSKIDSRTGTPVKISIFRMTWFRVAASVLIVTTIAAIFLTKSSSPLNSPSALRRQVPVIVAVNKFIELNDGTTVVLRTGSTLKVNADYNKKERVVTLIGEGYFDVKHNASKKFIVRTGGVTTTVLGTAFNIKAYPGQKSITVTVTRGLVSVAKNGRQIALLKPSMQINATPQNSQEAPIVTNIDNVTKWVSEDMKFSNMSFSKLANRLSERYHVTVSFKNPALGGCPITGRFKGTESLTDVLDILTVARNASYTLQDNHVIIDGPGCN